MILRLKKLSTIAALFYSSIFLLSAAEPASAEGKLKVVASTAMFGALVKEIGGDQVEVKNVSPPKFNAHFIQPRPSDVRNVSNADLFMFGGLDLEAWVDPLLQASGRPEFFRGEARSVDLSENVQLLKVPSGGVSRAQGDMHLFGNPHYYLSPENSKLIAKTILKKLSEVDPKNTPYYQANTEKFISKLDERILKWKTESSHCAGKEVYAYHDDVEYLAHFLGIRADKFIEPKPGISPSPKHIEELEKYAAKNPVKAILQAIYYPKTASEALGKRIGVPVILIAHNPGEGTENTDIFSMHEYNIKQITEALK